MIAFIQSRWFRRICYILIIAAIIYGIAAGTLSSSRVPARWDRSDLNRGE